MATIIPVIRELERRAALLDRIVSRFAHIPGAGGVASARTYPETHSTSSEGRLVPPRAHHLTRPARRCRAGLQPGLPSAASQQRPVGTTGAEVLARQLTSEITTGHTTIAELARKYRPDLERLGKVRPTSAEESTRRRLQEFLREHVYGVLIPEDELSPRIRNGRRTGGRRSPPAPE